MKTAFWTYFIAITVLSISLSIAVSWFGRNYHAHPMITAVQRRLRTDIRIWAVCFFGLALLTSWFESFPDFRLWQAWVLIPISLTEFFGGWSSALPHLFLGLVVFLSPPGCQLVCSVFHFRNPAQERRERHPVSPYEQNH